MSTRQILLRGLAPAIGGAAIVLAAAGLRGTAADAARPLPFFYDLYTFRGDEGRTTVVASFAVPAGRLEREDAGRTVRYRFDVTLVLADTAAGRVRRSDDSVFVSVPQALSADHLLFTFVKLDAPPSATTVQRVIMTDATRPGIGQLYGSAYAVPDYSGGDLMLSDIALGQPNAGGGWHRRGVTLALLPTSQFPASAFDVYYEVYNLPRGRPYVTEIAVRALDDGNVHGDDGAVRLRFADEAATAADGVLAELRRVDASLGRGRYRITVTVTDPASGRTASRSRTFEVRGWSRGVTLVPALQRAHTTSS